MYISVRYSAPRYYARRYFAVSFYIPIFLFHYRIQEYTKMAQLLKQSTAYTFQLGPFVDSFDGATPKTSLTIAATDIDISKNGGSFADKNDATALTGTGDGQGYYDCVLDTTDTGTLGGLEVRCYVFGALPVIRFFQVVPAHVYDGLIAGTDNLQVDTVQAAGTAWGSGAITAASIATDAIDTDALATDAVTEINTAVLSAISGIGTAGGAAINVDATTDNVGGGISGVTSGTTFAGTQSSGTFASTSNVNSVYHVITGTASGNTAMDIVYQFLTGSGTSVVQATWVGYVTGTNDTITVSAWRHDTNAWESMTTIVGTTSSATIQTKNITLYARHRGTSTAELGKVYLRLHCTGMTTPVVGTDQLAVSYAVSSRGTYSDGAVWLNTAASNTNTQSYVDGLPENPVSTIAAALTIATNLNLKRIRIANGSSITLAASVEARSLVGKNWSLNLGGQSISGSYFEGATVSGTGTGALPPEFVECHIVGASAAPTLPPCTLLRCGINTTASYPLTAGSAGQFLLVDCFSEVAGSGTPYFTFSGANGVNIRRWSGGTNITLDNASTALSVEVVTGGGQTIAVGGADVEIRGICRAVTLTGVTSNTTAQINAVTGPITISGADGTVNIYGVCGVVTDNRTGTPTLTNKAVSQEAINTEVVDVLRTDTLPDDYAAHEAQPTFAEAILAIHQFLFERSVSGTTVTVQKPDGTTSAMTLTLDDANNPTAVHRSA